MQCMNVAWNFNRLDQPNEHTKNWSDELLCIENEKARPPYSYKSKQTTTSDLEITLAFYEQRDSWTIFCIQSNFCAVGLLYELP